MQGDKCTLYQSTGTLDLYYYACTPLLHKSQTKVLGPRTRSLVCTWTKSSEPKKIEAIIIISSNQ